MRKIKSALRDFKYGIINLYRYFRVIWENRDWDYEYIYSLLLVKLKYSQAYLQNNQILESDEEKAKEIGVAISMLRKTKDNYWFSFKGVDEAKEYVTLDEMKEFCEKYECSVSDATLILCAEEKAHKEFFNYLRDHVGGWWN